MHPKVYEADACAIAAGFWTEMKTLTDSMDSPSSSFLVEAARLKDTKHGHKLNQLFKKYGLTIDMPMERVDLGLSTGHPVLQPRAFITMLSQENKLDLLFCGHTEDDYFSFRQQSRLLQGDHPVFQVHRSELPKCIPIWLFADEGPSQKRNR